MLTVLTTTDAVLLGFAEVVLADAGIAAIVADRFTSAIEGALGIFPCRLLVPADDWAQARRALIAAGLGANLPQEPMGAMQPVPNGAPDPDGEPA